MLPEDSRLRDDDGVVPPVFERHVPSDLACDQISDGPFGTGGYGTPRPGSWGAGGETGGGGSPVTVFTQGTRVVQSAATLAP
jgi:hypothetical protein